MNYKNIIMVLFLSLFVLGGCSPSSPPAAELTVWNGSCHVIGNDVYFDYNGDSYIAKNQASEYNSQNVGDEISVIELQDGSFIIPIK